MGKDNTRAELRLIRAAVKRGLIDTDACNGCGNESRKRWRVVEGMYNGFLYCRPCVVAHLRRHLTEHDGRNGK